MPAEIAIIPQSTDSETSAENVRKCVARRGASDSWSGSLWWEFISIFGGIPIAVWQRLPEKIQDRVTREAAATLAELLGSRHDTIDITGKDRHQILTAVARQRVAEYGNYSQAAKTLGIDRRTLKTYLEEEEVRG